MRGSNDLKSKNETKIMGEDTVHGVGSGLMTKLHGCEAYNKCCFCIPIRVGMYIIAAVSIFFTGFNLAQCLLSIFSGAIGFGLLTLLMLLPGFWACYYMYKWLSEDNQETRNKVSRAIILYIMTSIAVGIWELVGHLLWRSITDDYNFFENICIMLLSICIQFYYLAVTIRFSKQFG